MRHHLGDDLSALNLARQRAWRRLTQGAPWKRLAARLGIMHWIRGTDDTYGANGWHPHLHVLVFTRSMGGEREQALRDLRVRWQGCVAKALGSAHVPSSRGVDLRTCRREDYIAKLGLEIVAPNTKRARGVGRTPWEVANDAAQDDAASLRLWVCYTRAMKGVRQLTWSRKLRAAAQLGEDVSDQAIVDAVDHDAPEKRVASIPAAIWDEIAGKRGATFAMLRAAEDDDIFGVAIVIALYKWGLAPPEPGEHLNQIILDLVEAITPLAKEDRELAA